MATGAAPAEGGGRSPSRAMPQVSKAMPLAPRDVLYPPVARGRPMPLARFATDTFERSAASASRRDRGARWPEVNASCGNPAEASRLVLRSMLQQDALNTGQRSDLEFVLSVLDKIGHGNDHVREDAAVKQLDSSGLDESTRDYIKTLLGVKKAHKTLREVVQGIMFVDRLRGAGKKQHARTQKRATLQEALAFDFTIDTQQGLANLDTYGGFDIYAVAETTKHPLQVVTVATLHQRSLLEKFNIQLDTLHNFLGAVESQYLSVPYHNAMHAADVVQSTHALLIGELDSQFSELEVLTLVFAASVHDVAHPGVTNQFRVGRRDEGAIIYNDVSVNEMMHCSTAYQVLHAQGNNFLETLSREQESAVRKTTIDVILATDMANHFKHLKTFNETVDSRGREITHWDSPAIALEMVLHTADISNVTKAKGVALRWTDRVLEEFFQQGDQERDLRVPISPLCDRHTVSKAKSQCGFVDFIVKPQFEALGRICNLEHAMTAMGSYTEYWKEVLETETAAENKPEGSQS